MRRGALRYVSVLSLAGCLFGGDPAGDPVDDPVKTVDRLVASSDAPDDAPPPALRDVAGLDAHNTVRANAQPPPSPP
ncbi:MAG: hypothetical protein AAF602_28700, partial [Myxococcota bacterium]